eukprot:8395861-Pyramimonas_sp.AAC.1
MRSNWRAGIRSNITGKNTDSNEWLNFENKIFNLAKVIKTSRLAPAVNCQPGHHREPRRALST